MINISKVLHSTLIGLGISPKRIDVFDQHSTIELSFKGISPIYIAAENDRVWVWAKLSELNAHDIDFYSRALIGFLQYPLPGVLTGQAVFGKGQEGYELKALLDNDCASSIEEMGQMLESFYDLLVLLYAELRN